MTTAAAAEPKVLTPDVPEGEDVEVLIPDQPEAAGTEGGEDGLVAPPVARPEPVAPVVGLEEIQRQLDAKTREAEESKAKERAAVALAQEQSRLAAEAQERGISMQEMLLTTHVETAQKEVDSLTASYEAALSAGDYKQAAQVNAQLGRATAKADRLENEKSTWEQRRKEFSERAEQAPEDPAERALQAYSPRAREWFRAHPDKLQQNGSPAPDVLRAHHGALAKELVPDSPEYFAHIEEQLSLASPPPPPPAPPVVPAAPAQRRAAAPSVAAPVSRAAPNGSPQIVGNTITLKPRHRAAAAMSDMTEAEYGQYLAKAVNEGRLPRSALD